MTAFLFTCEQVPDYCGKGYWYNPDFQFCFAKKTYDMCNGKTFNPLTQGCNKDRNEVGTMCADENIVPLGTPCGGYTLTTASIPADGGSIGRTPKDTVNYVAGYRLVLNATPTAGYRFAGWTGASASTDSILTLTMESNTPLVAIFSPASEPGATAHRLVTTAFPPNGGSVTPATGTHSAGTDVTATATAALGYTFSGWSGASISTSPSTIINMNDGKTLVAMFTPIVYTLTANPSPRDGGAVFINGTALAGAAPQNAGTTVEALARPTDGYVFTGWSGATTGTENPVTINITNSNQTLTATFSRDDRADPCAASPQTTPGCPGYNPCLGMASALPGSACCAYNPNYQGCSGTISVTTYTVTYNINGGTGATPTAQTVGAGSGVTLARGDGLTRDGYTFGGWNVNAAGSGTNYNAGTPFTPAADITLYALWNVRQVVTPGDTSSFLDGRDGQRYPVVTIGTQTWMAKNLNFNASGSVCYRDSTRYCDIYGRLYDWNAAMSACPPGWHLPTDAEWTMLTDAVGGASTAGRVLKSEPPDWDGTNVHGFSALPGGSGFGGSFNFAGSSGLWWSATENDASSARGRNMVTGDENVNRNASSKAYSFSVLCLQD